MSPPRQAGNRSRYEEGEHTVFVGESERCERRADASLAKPLSA